MIGLCVSCSEMARSIENVLFVLFAIVVARSRSLRLLEVADGLQPLITVLCGGSSEKEAFTRLSIGVFNKESTMFGTFYGGCALRMRLAIDADDFRRGLVHFLFFER